MLEELKNRRSIRKFSESQIKDEDLEKILEAGMYAPSGKGKQSPYFAVIQNKELLDELIKCNAEVMKADVNPFYGAPTVIVVFADKNVPTYHDDGVLAAGNMLNEIHSLGLGGCYIYRCKEQFETENGKILKEKLGVNEDYVGIANVIVGYPMEQPEAKSRKENYYKVLK